MIHGRPGDTAGRKALIGTKISKPGAAAEFEVTNIVI